TSSLDFETKSSYSVRVRSTDQGGLWFEKEFVITVTNVNETPTGVSLSSTSIAENAGANATVGTLSTTDPDASNTFTYSLVTGTGDTDNSAFNISGADLRATSSLDFETKSSYSVRVRSTDQGGLWFEKEFVITVTNVNDAPVLVASSGSANTSGAAVVVDPGIGLSDVDSATIASAVVSISSGLVSIEDRLLFDN
ncbi:MAG: cadherin domain-containing protein, partial [Pirellulaceae bacterium]